MEDGLFFWVIILAVAVLQGIGQRKKKPGQLGQKPPGPPLPQPAPPEDQDRVSVSPRPTGASPRSGQVAGESQSSEGMIPEDVWKEILGLARGGPRQAEAEPQPPVEPELVPREREAPGRGVKAAAGGARAKTLSPQEVRPFPTSHGAGGGLHKTKPGDFGSRLGVSRASPWGSEPGPCRTVRAGLFGSGSPKQLQKAIILKEVLGPPIALRDEGE